MRRPLPRALVPLLAVLILLPPPGGRAAEPALDADSRAAIDAVVRDALASSGVPSASIAVVRDGRIAYVQAYGSARLDPPAPAAAAMRYSIGSVSKQFTATAVLMLAEEGKLSLDDPVSRFVPGPYRAPARSRSASCCRTPPGYQDYWPQDYVPPFMLQPTTAAGDPRPLGEEAPRLPSGHAVPVLEHRIRARRNDRREGGRDAAAAVSHGADLPAAPDGERREHRPGAARRHRSRPGTCATRSVRCARRRRRARAGSSRRASSR